MQIPKLLTGLELTPDNSVVIGSGILSALGLRSSNDVDVVVTEAAFARLAQDSRFVEKQNHGRTILAYDLFEILPSWGVLGKDQTFADLSNESMVIEGVRYITPQFLLAAKRSWLTDEGRPKDLADVKLIEDYLNEKERSVRHSRESRGRTRRGADDPISKDSRVSDSDRRIRVGVLLGGASAEREISLASGKMIAEHLPRDRYEVVLFDSLALMAGNPRLPADLARKAQALLAHGGAREELADRDRQLPAAFQSEIQSAAAEAAPATEAVEIVDGRRRIDVAFIGLHGPYGEDGTLQGMLEILGVPYVGSGVLASALAMDKTMAAKMLAAEGVPVALAVVVEREELDGETMRRASALIPAFVKPSRQGSSIGMSQVGSPAELRPALEKAFEYDDRVLVEKRLDGREITVGVIGNRRLMALPVVEIVTRSDFFDYQAKYDPDLSEEICPAKLTPAETQQVQDLALRAHRALDCRGYSRVDMIITKDRGPVVIEVNTLPGMTINSLFPKAARAAGIPFGELLDRLIRLALGEE